MTEQEKSAVPVVVQKYGGTSVGTAERILAIAERIERNLPETPRLVVVLSAMGSTTDELVSLAHQVSERPAGREMDLLLSTGEQITVSLLGLALQDRGLAAVSLTALQCGIRTDGVFNVARIRSIDTERIRAELDAGRVVIVTGFQGINDSNDVTTLGRGGSDITGAALASALGAEACEICTDVDGVFSADPSRVPGARLWAEISYEEAIEMASSGAKVLHPRAAEICMEYDVPIHVRSSFHLREGTWIRGGGQIMERAEVVSVTSDSKIAKITLLDVPDEPGMAARVFEDLAKAGVNIRLIIQSASSERQGRITFILDLEFLDDARELVQRWETEGVTSSGVVESDVAKISIVGSRLASSPGLAARMFAALGRAGINIDCISSSEMKVACVISADRRDEATRAVHNEFFPENETATASA
jgi:aspartate kinase|tara:strand:+ start:4468 stop:5727 length:1260 start_codon:yes stop_codon:yes gene_type:complete